MIDWSEEAIHNLGIAINEATVREIDVDLFARAVDVTLRVLTLPEVGPAPYDHRVVLALSPVGRIAASLKNGPWGEAPESIEPLPIASLSDVFRSFHGCDICGWEFFDCRDEANLWSHPVSVDWRDGVNGLAHTLDLFHYRGISGQDGLVNMRIWFDDMTIYTPARAVVSVNEFIASGRRWWKALFKSNPNEQAQRFWASM